ncbi:hypothetical protein CQW23_20839 [Capsicum baccatum]|uniref:AB hydrolase-1 domain-containing protein n=1 Tax=Capsicum baccatum TaxID=33114 RepID=A0A2G2W9S8_CAPBA|nr:hypothetical protein CQW23_20839 [Capsicum baccatum]
MTTFSAAIVSSAAIVGTRTSAQIKRTKVKYMTSGLNSFGGLKASLGLPLCSLQTPSQTKGPKAKKQFVLIHTGGHGAWCWYKIVELMKSSGHNVTALDMGASGTNAKQTLQVTHFSDYLNPLMEFTASLPADEKIVLVGHSISGLGISKAMETFPEKIPVAVFLAALMPGPTFSANTIYTEVPIFHN